MSFGKYVLNILIGFDQLVNTFLAGHPDETLSSRAYRYQSSSKFWGAVRVFVDGLFFWQKDHCYNAYLIESSCHLLRDKHAEIQEKIDQAESVEDLKKVIEGIL